MQEERRALVTSRAESLGFLALPVYSWISRFSGDLQGFRIECKLKKHVQTVQANVFHRSLILRHHSFSTVKVTQT